jgi:hypothetical protein
MRGPSSEARSLSRFNNPIPPTLPRSAKSQLRLVRRQGGMRKRRLLRHNVGRGSLRRFNLSNFRSVAPKSKSLPVSPGKSLYVLPGKEEPLSWSRENTAPRCSRRKAPSRPNPVAPRPRPKDTRGASPLRRPRDRTARAPLGSLQPRPIGSSVPALGDIFGTCSGV